MYKILIEPINIEGHSHTSITVNHISWFDFMLHIFNDSANSSGASEQWTSQGGAEEEDPKKSLNVRISESSSGPWSFHSKVQW